MHPTDRNDKPVSQAGIGRPAGMTEAEELRWLLDKLDEPPAAPKPPTKADWTQELMDAISGPPEPPHFEGPPDAFWVRNAIEEHYAHHFGGIEAVRAFYLQQHRSMHRSRLRSRSNARTCSTRRTSGRLWGLPTCRRRGSPGSWAMCWPAAS
jgi:hypothetical protein